ncbi:bifunctional lysylphosphatidylglycerol flippase/synthetase MprF [Phenylobacterium sp. LjRoot164]|uniref:bifunctional lysylphosphatidylglycerol flippase/synthetase MprF n=1 Tax=unclassified Phenylobacterium TaxID=2640670 RepID=UPI003ECF9CAE
MTTFKSTPDPPIDRAGQWLRKFLWLRQIVDSDGFRISFAVFVFAAALWVLQRQLHGQSLARIAHAMNTVSPAALLVAVGATLASYACLAVSERWALASIGRPASTRQVALVTFVSYALSNGLGFSAATGGAARLRLYRAWGLGLADVAVVTLLAGAAVTLSGIVCAGMAMLMIPGAAPIVAWLGALALTPAAFWLVRLPRRIALLPGIEFTRPAPALRVGALAAGIADWVFSGLALYVLLPEPTLAGLSPFLIVFVLGSLVSAATGLPGGIGVFDAILLSLSQRFGAVHETVAALVLYRLVYAIGPLVLTALGLAAYQLQRLGRAATKTSLRVAEAIAPAIFAALVFYMGVALLMAAANLPVALPPPRPWMAELPRNPLSTSLLGALLVIVAMALWRRLKAGFYASLALLALGAATELWHGFGVVTAALLVALALALGLSRHAFNPKSASPHDIVSPAWLAAASLAGVTSLVLALAPRDVQILAAHPWWRGLRPSGDFSAAAVSAGLAVLGLLIAIWWLARPRSAPPRPPSEDEMARAGRIVDGTRAISCDALLYRMGDKSLVFSPSGMSFVMFRALHRRWIAMGDPVGPLCDRSAAIEAFIAAADAAEAKPVFYAVEAPSLPALLVAGLSAQKIGESGSVDLSSFDMKGKEREDLRHALNNASRSHLQFEVLAPDAPATPWNELRRVSDSWLDLHAGAEKTFSLGAFDVDYLRQFPIAILRNEQRVVAFANILLTPDRARFGPDLMRAAADAPHGVTDALLGHLMLWGKTQKLREFELGMAPLSGLSLNAVAPASTRLEAWLYRAADSLYGFQGLREYKEKFRPAWRDIFLATDPDVNPLVALADVALLTSGGARKLLRRPRLGSRQVLARLWMQP